MRVLAIDPGPVESAYALIDSTDCEAIRFGKVDNHDLRSELNVGLLSEANYGAIEMVASYGMSVGAEVFDTCVWIGRFIEVSGCGLHQVYRREVKMHHCGQTKASDANIRQALVDRFAYGVGNYGKGTKAKPGWFHGFSADVWQAYALATLVADRITGRQGVADAAGYGSPTEHEGESA